MQYILQYGHIAIDEKHYCNMHRPVLNTQYNTGTVPGVGNTRTLEYTVYSRGTGYLVI